MATRHLQALLRTPFLVDNFSFSLSKHWGIALLKYLPIKKGKVVAISK
jgi:hypothetical protein